MRRALLIAPVMFAIGLTACGSTEDGSDPAPTEESGDFLTFSTGEFEIPAGDSFTCFYTNTFTDRELSVIGASGSQGPGGHHILAYYAEQEHELGHHECVDSEMVNLHQIAGASGKGTASEGSVLSLPDGLALKVPAGKQLVLQAHYINTSGAPMKVNDTVGLKLVDPATVKSYVNYFVTLDEKFKIEPNAALTRVSTCKLDRDFDMVIILGHMHELGKHYTLETIDADGKSLEKIRDDEWLPSYSSHPPISNFPMDAPYHLSKGTILRQTCSWDNTTPETVLFPREMCLAFSYYFPGDGDLICDMTPVEPTQ